jgi:hypothetical protein
VLIFEKSQCRQAPGRGGRAVRVYLLYGRVLRPSGRLQSCLRGFERSLLPDSSKILTGLLGSLLANVAHQVVDVVLHSHFAQGHADVN